MGPLNGMTKNDDELGSRHTVPDAIASGLRIKVPDADFAGYLPRSGTFELFLVIRPGLDHLPRAVGIGWPFHRRRFAIVKEELTTLQHTHADLRMLIQIMIERCRTAFGRTNGNEIWPDQDISLPPGLATFCGMLRNDKSRETPSNGKPK